MRSLLAALTASVSLLPIQAVAQSGTIRLDEVVVAAETGETGGSTETGAADGSADAAPGDGNGAGEGSVGGTGFAEGTANSTTITQGQLERENPQDLADVFQTDPGVVVGSSIPMSQKLYVQGVEEPNLAVTIDGTRQNNRIFHHSATTLVDPDLLKAVRVDPGVAPADAGPGALGGAIAFETKDVGDLLQPGRMFGGLIGGEYITNGDIFSTNAALYGRYQGFEALAYGKWADGGIRKDGNGNDIVGSGTGLLSGIGKLAYEAPTGDRIEAAFEIVNDDEARPYRSNIGVIVGGRPVPLTRNYEMQRQNFTLTYTDESPGDWWDPKVQIGYSVTDLDIPEDEQRSQGTTGSFNGRAQNTIHGGFGSITFGTDFFIDSTELDYRYYPDRTSDESGDEHAQNVGVYTQARLDWTPRLRTSFGARVDLQHFEGNNGYDITDAGPSLNVTGEYDVTDFLTAYAGASRVWAGFPLTETFILNPNWDYSGDLVPTTSDNLVAGLKANWRGFSAGAKVFQTQIYDARTPDYNVGAFVQRDVRTRGYELTAGYSSHGFDATVGYAYVDADLDGNSADSDLGRYLTTPLGHIVKAAASYTYAPWGLTVGANAEFAFENDDTFDPYFTAPPDPIPGYEVVNAFAEWTPPRYEHITLRVEANNIFDEAYVSRATYGQEYTSQGITPLYEPGRSFTLRATARY